MAREENIVTTSQLFLRRHLPFLFTHDVAHRTLDLHKRTRKFSRKNLLRLHRTCAPSLSNSHQQFTPRRGNRLDWIWIALAFGKRTSITTTCLCSCLPRPPVAACSALSAKCNFNKDITSHSLMCRRRADIWPRGRRTRTTRTRTSVVVWKPWSARKGFVNIEFQFPRLSLWIPEPDETTTRSLFPIPSG